jgi:4'-phosphopantetheinyl transferase
VPLHFETIRPFTVEVWVAALDSPPVPYSELQEYLSAEERSRSEAFVFPRDRIRYVTTRGLLRAILGPAIRRDAAAVAFRYSANGRPELDGNEAVVFNVSHSGDRAAIAVAAGDSQLRLGIDIELEREIPDIEAVARLVFTSTELLALSAIASAGRTRLFHRLWTKKEACMKATGAGFQLDPLAFELDADAVVQQVALPSPAQGLRPTLTVHDLGPSFDAGLAGAVAVSASDWAIAVRRLDSRGIRM